MIISLKSVHIIYLIIIKLPGENIYMKIASVSVIVINALTAELVFRQMELVEIGMTLAVNGLTACLENQNSAMTLKQVISHMGLKMRAESKKSEGQNT